MPRLFTAVDPPPTWHAPLGVLATNTLNARWTPPVQYHMTLRFIGEVPESKAHEIAEAMDGVRAEAVTLKAHGLLTFPSRRNPRVLAVAIEKTAPLERLYTAVEDALQSVGEPPEVRAYRPHMTLARLKRPDPRRVRAFVKQHADLQLDPALVDALHLYESHLHPEGARHLRRHTVPLTGTS